MILNQLFSPFIFSLAWECLGGWKIWMESLPLQFNLQSSFVLVNPGSSLSCGRFLTHPLPFCLRHTITFPTSHSLLLCSYLSVKAKVLFNIFLGECHHIWSHFLDILVWLHWYVFRVFILWKVFLGWSIILWPDSWRLQTRCTVSVLGGRRAGGAERSYFPHSPGPPRVLRCSL